MHMINCSAPSVHQKLIDSVDFSPNYSKNKGCILRHIVGTNTVVTHILWVMTKGSCWFKLIMAINNC